MRLREERKEKKTRDKMTRREKKENRRENNITREDKKERGEKYYEERT